MTTAYYCQKCLTKMTAAQGLAGRVVTCPYCQQATELIEKPEESKLITTPDPAEGSELGGASPLNDESQSAEPKTDLLNSGGTTTMSSLLSSTDGTGYGGTTADGAPSTVATVDAASPARPELEDLRFDLHDDDSDMAYEQLLGPRELELRDAMRKVASKFQPNPFAVSFALDQTSLPEDEQDADKPSNADLESSGEYDVDELIKGIEGHETGF